MEEAEAVAGHPLTMRLPRETHLNPSHRKVPCLGRSAAWRFDSSAGTHSSAGSSRLQLPSDPAEDNRQLRLRLEQVRRRNRELLGVVLGQERQIAQAGREYGELQLRYKCERQRTARRLRGTWKEEEDTTLRRSRSRGRALRLREALEGLDFREAERLAGGRGTPR